MTLRFPSPNSSQLCEAFKYKNLKLKKLLILLDLLAVMAVTMSSADRLDMDLKESQQQSRERHPKSSEVASKKAYVRPPQYVHHLMSGSSMPERRMLKISELLEG